MNIVYLTRRKFLLLVSSTIGSGLLGANALKAFISEGDRFREYVEAVTSGTGFLPWQERGISLEEVRFREQIEARKSYLFERARAKSPHFLFADDDIQQLKQTVDSSSAGKKWFRKLKARVDHMLVQPPGYVQRMIPELTPTNVYGWTCPNCVGEKSQEGNGSCSWNFKEPEMLSCRFCGQTYPSEKYPETARLVCPRRGQIFSFYLNDAQRRHSEDRSGKYAYKWAIEYPINISFSGRIRAYKIRFMISSAKRLALTFRITDDRRYAELARDILLRLADCYTNWLYHDYRDTFADCDPLFAAWHDKSLPLTFKRHLFIGAYDKDLLKKAAMLQTYWGAGRIWPSTDAIHWLAQIVMAYDLILSHDHSTEKHLWDDTARGKVEKDLILEYLIGSEPFLGGPNKAVNRSNKAPRAYYAMACVGGTLRLPEFVQTAMNGYVNILKRAFLPDGFSRQSPSYTNKYLVNLTRMANILNNSSWALDASGKSELSVANVRLKLAFRAILDQLRPDGSFFPLAGTPIGGKPSAVILKNAARTNPSLYPDGTPHSGIDILADMGVPSLHKGLAKSSEEPPDVQKPEIYFPSWMTAILRHQGKDRQSALALTFSPSGGHRHRDNLALFYEDGEDILLGDHGYVGDSPVNRWVKSTFSHNLVIVDNREQEFSDRRPNLHRMLTSPAVSIVEASSRVYSQCSDYKRLVILFKGPSGTTFVVDIFRVKGGNTHDYRIFSEIASSDDKHGGMVFSGLDIPAASPLGRVGAGLGEREIFGLTGASASKNPSETWAAVWKGSNRAYRLWFLTPADEVVVSSGPGQEKKEQIGRRVRYLDAVRKGTNIGSTFVAVHEPLEEADSGPIESIERVNGIESAGNQALGLKIRTKWGVYHILNYFDRVTEVQGIQFKGKIAVLNETPNGKAWALASETEILEYGPLGFSDQPAYWSDPVHAHTANSVTMKSPKPEVWPTIPNGCQNYALVSHGKYRTGYPISTIDKNRIGLARFPLMAARHCNVPSFFYQESC